jgi:hypothetical protein
MSAFPRPGARPESHARKGIALGMSGQRRPD